MIDKKIYMLSNNFSSYLQLISRNASYITKDQISNEKVYNLRGYSQWLMANEVEELSEPCMEVAS